LHAPVIAGWSLGGRVIRQYLMHYGDRRLGGINFVSCRPIEDPNVSLRNYPPIPSDGSRDLATCIETAIAFLRACFNEQPNQEDFEQMLAFNMIVPLEVREAIAGWATGISETIKALNTVTVPTLITHGTADRLILPAAAQMTATAIKHSTISLYEGCGHSPFFEFAARFNRELTKLVADVEQHRR
jgi:pimeloyl-ACP methyl ester carboxylesterase